MMSVFSSLSRMSRRDAMTLIVVAVITGIAFALRWLFAFRSGIWRDEALFLYIIRYPNAGDVLQFLIHHESHPPLFYMLMHGWGRLVGANDNYLFIPPVLFGTLLVPTAYVVGTRVFNRGIGLAGALFCAINMLLVSTSGLLRPYSFLPVVVLCSLYCLWRALYDLPANPPASLIYKRWSVWALCMIVLIYTHNWAWIIFAGEWVLVAILFLLRKWGLNWAASPALIVRGWILGQALIVIAFLPWLGAFLGQVRNAGHGPQAVMMPFFYLLGLFADLILSLPDKTGKFVLPVIFLAFIVVCIVERRSRSTQEAVQKPAFSSLSGMAVFTLMPVVTCMLAWLADLKTGVLWPRCIAMLIPPILIACAAWLFTIARKDVYRIGSVILVAIGMLYGTLLNLDIPKANTRELAALVMQKARPNDLIVIVPEQAASSFNYYYQGTQEQIDFPEHRRVQETPFDHWIDKLKDPIARQDTENAIVAARRSGRRIWFIALENNLLGGVPVNDADVPDPLMKTWFVSCIRASQIRDRLVQLYGKPSGMLYPNPTTEEDQEGELALLFTPKESGGTVPAHTTAAP